MGLLRWLFSKSATRFGLVGGTGFVIDYILLIVLIQWADLMPLAARVISIAVTSFVIWPFHRNYAFTRSDDGPSRELVRYYLVVIAAALINYLGFALWHTFFVQLPLITAMIFGAFVGMITSFVGFRFFVFRQNDPSP